MALFCCTLEAIAFSTNTNILGFGLCFLVTFTGLIRVPLFIIFTSLNQRFSAPRALFRLFTQPCRFPLKVRRSLHPKRQSLPFRSPEFSDRACQVFCPLNFIFLSTQKAVAVFSCNCWIYWCPGKSMLRSSCHFPIQLSKITHIVLPRLLPFRAQTGLPRSCLT